MATIASPLTITPVHPALGAEVSGLDLTRPEDLQDFLWALFMHPEFQLIY